MGSYLGPYSTLFIHAMGHKCVGDTQKGKEGHGEGHVKFCGTRPFAFCDGKEQSDLTSLESGFMLCPKLVEHSFEGCFFY